MQDLLLRFLFFDFGIDLQRCINILVPHPFLDPFYIKVLVNKNGYTGCAQSMKFSALRKIRIFFDHFFELLGRIVRIVEASVLVFENIIVIIVCLAKQFTVFGFHFLEMLEHFDLIVCKRVRPVAGIRFSGIQAIDPGPNRNRMIYAQCFRLKVYTGPAKSQHFLPP